MRESQFTASLRDELRGSVYTLKLNVRYYKGVADCYYSGSRDDLWTEHKFFSSLPPIIDLTDPGITTVLQQTWLVARHNEGRNVGMIVGTLESRKAHGLFLPELEWRKPLTRDEFRARMKNKKELARELIELLGPVEGPILP